MVFFTGNCLIGMDARVLDGAHVGEFSLVAAGSLVLQGDKVPSNSLVAGVPAIVKRTLTPEELNRLKLLRRRGTSEVGGVLQRVKLEPLRFKQDSFCFLS